jgi:hypothetical protein
VGLPTATAVQTSYEELPSLTARLKAQDAQIAALHAELRLLAVDLPTQGKRYASNAKLDAPLKTMPAKMDGPQTVTAPLTSA